MINFNRISDRIFVGTCPASAVDVRRLAQAGIDAVVNLQTDQDFIALGIDWPALEHAYFEQGIEVYRYPMIDFDEADIESRLRAAAAVVNDALDAGHRIYLHCTAGQERSPTTAAAWLTLFGDRSPDDALQQVKQARKSRPYSEMVMRLVEPSS